MISAWFGPTRRNMLARMANSASIPTIIRIAITMTMNAVPVIPQLPPSGRLGRVAPLFLHELFEGLHICDAPFGADDDNFVTALERTSVFATGTCDPPRPGLAVHHFSGASGPDSRAEPTDGPGELEILRSEIGGLAGEEDPCEEHKDDAGPGEADESREGHRDDSQNAEIGG